MERSMEANNEQRECILCHQFFTPDPRIKNQNVCSSYLCQRLRQKLNHLDWLERNPVDYKQWYQDYGKSYRQRHPNYQRQYRQQQKKRSAKYDVKDSATSQMMIPLLKAYQSGKKEVLTSEISNVKRIITTEKKEQLTHCFILLRAKELSVLPLFPEKKEELTFCFNTS